MSSSENSRSNIHWPGGDYFKAEEVVLKPCHICGRTFNPVSLERHAKVCETTKKCIRRNVFNSFSQRAKEIAAIPLQNDLKDEEKKKCKKSKEDHEHNSHTRSKRNSGLNLMNNGMSQQNKTLSGHQQCPCCNRCFSEKAADRHIAWCMEQQTRLPKTPPNSEALERLKARVKYRAPLPRRKENDSNIRLVKSAESIREPSVMRTHSSPPIPIHDVKISRLQSVENGSTSVLKSRVQKKVDRNISVGPSNFNSSDTVNSNNSSESQVKKAVKFKEIFPVYKKDRNKNLDMLAALKLRLSELEMSDDLLDDCFMKSNENEVNRNHATHNFLATRDIWTSDGEVHGSNSSSSDGSLPSLSSAESSEQRMPRFCYNCGTKYPIVSAKFCCECGARRFALGANNQLYA